MTTLLANFRPESDCWALAQSEEEANSTNTLPTPGTVTPSMGRGTSTLRTVPNKRSERGEEGIGEEGTGERREWRGKKGIENNKTFINANIVK